MIHFFLIALAASRFVLLTTPLADSDRQVLLVDAYSFGLTYEGAKICQAACVMHHEAMRSEIPEAFREAWNERMWVRRQRWAMLIDALDEELPAIQRLERLNQLRESLGTAEFFAGRMVSAIPEY
jgi:hypothetical protein